MSIKDLYLQLISYPDSPKFYRDLRDYYRKANMNAEADAFAFLLQTKFREVQELHVDGTPVNQEQR